MVIDRDGREVLAARRAACRDRMRRCYRRRAYSPSPGKELSGPSKEISRTIRSAFGSHFEQTGCDTVLLRRSTDIFAKLEQMDKEICRRINVLNCRES